jgi:hypothetical protein
MAVQNPQPSDVASDAVACPDDAPTRAPGSHIALSEGEAALVHLVAEGMDVAAIASTTGVSRQAARKQLRALATRLAKEARNSTNPAV